MVKAIFVIIGTIIGAGFASGQEIYSFFNIYKENGILGIIIASIIIGTVIYKVLITCNKLNTKTYKELLEKNRIPKKIVKIFYIIINLFLIISFYIMATGFTAYFKQEFSIPTIITAIFVAILCYITFLKNIEGIAKINTIIIPILIIIILALGFKSDIINIMSNFKIQNINLSLDWFLKSIEYAGYNTILLIPMLINLKKYTKNKEKQISIISTFIFFIITTIIYFIMYNYNNLSNIEIPLVFIASQFGDGFKIIYGIVIILAIYTTIISSGYSFLTNCTKTESTYKLLAKIICFLVLFVYSLSFAGLVNLTYPVFGLLGVIQLICFLDIKK